MTKNSGYLSQTTGRRRKLSDGAMIDICNQYAKGASVASLATAYGVSTHLVYTVVYWTARDVPEDRK